jgi:hypothetical protein
MKRSNRSNAQLLSDEAIIWSKATCTSDEVINFHVLVYFYFHPHVHVRVHVYVQVVSCPLAWSCPRPSELHANVQVHCTVHVPVHVHVMYIFMRIFICTYFMYTFMLMYSTRTWRRWSRTYRTWTCMYMMNILRDKHEQWWLISGAVVAH